MNSHPRVRNPLISPQLNNPGTYTQIPGVDTAPQVWKPQPRWVIADWLGLMEPARGESCPSGQRRGPAAPGEDKFPSPGQKLFYISTTNSNNLAGVENGDPPGRYCPARCGNPSHTGWLLIGWGSWSQRVAAGPSGQGRGYAAHGEDKVPSPDQKSFRISATPTNREPRR